MKYLICCILIYIRKYNVVGEPKPSFTHNCLGKLGPCVILDLASWVWIFDLVSSLVGFGCYTVLPPCWNIFHAARCVDLWGIWVEGLLGVGQKIHLSWNQNVLLEISKRKKERKNREHYIGNTKISHSALSNLNTYWMLLGHVSNTF